MTTNRKERSSVNKTRTAIGAVSLAALLTLPACGGEDSSGSDDAATDTASAPAGAPGGFDAEQLQEIQQCLEAAGLEDKLPTGQPDGVPTDLPSDFPTDLPTDLPSDSRPTSAPEVPAAAPAPSRTPRSKQRSRPAASTCRRSPIRAECGWIPPSPVVIEVSEWMHHFRGEMMYPLTRTRSQRRGSSHITRVVTSRRTTSVLWPLSGWQTALVLATRPG